MIALFFYFSLQEEIYYVISRKALFVQFIFPLTVVEFNMGLNIKHYFDLKKLT